MTMEMDPRDKEFLISVLTDRSINAGDHKDFFKGLGKQADLPNDWVASYLAQIKDDARFSSQNVVDWALGMEVNRKNRSFTTLGSILRPLVKYVGLDTAQRLVVIIVTNRLIRDKDQLTQLMKDYGVPFPTTGTAGNVADISIPLGPAAVDTKIGPEMVWRGPDEVTLQGFSWSQPDYMDGGFLMRATDRALSVCHVSIPGKRSGTGFLIEKNTLLITNYHVLEDPETPGDDKDQNAANAVLKFKYLSSTEGEEEDAQEFKLTDKPIIDSSPVPELDFVLLRVKDSITKAEGIKPLAYKDAGLPTDKSLNIIQHPQGGPLMFAFSSNGVTGVYDDGRIQYVSKAAGGSSGSPCFNDKWELVALHHAERSTMWGVRREGLLFDHIFRKIKDKIAN